MTVEYTDRPEENQRALESPGFFCNKFWVHVHPSGMLRIAFGEFTSRLSTPQVRAAVVLDPAMAADLIASLSHIMETMHAAAQPAAPQQDGGQRNGGQDFNPDDHIIKRDPKLN